MSIMQVLKTANLALKLLPSARVPFELSVFGLTVLACLPSAVLLSLPSSERSWCSTLLCLPRAADGSNDEVVLLTRPMAVVLRAGAMSSDVRPAVAFP